MGRLRVKLGTMPKTLGIRAWRALEADRRGKSVPKGLQTYRRQVGHLKVGRQKVPDLLKTQYFQVIAALESKLSTTPDLNKDGRI